MEHVSPSEIDNSSVNEKNSPQCMEAENSLPYCPSLTGHATDPYREHSELSPRFH
jgi:hypothetical protein